MPDVLLSPTVPLSLEMNVNWMMGGLGKVLDVVMNRV